MEETKETTTQVSKNKDKRIKRNYPRIPLETCLIVAQKIRELNGGNPWTPEEVGKAIGVSKQEMSLYIMLVLQEISD